MELFGESWEDDKVCNENGGCCNLVVFFSMIFWTYVFWCRFQKINSKSFISLFSAPQAIFLYIFMITIQFVVDFWSFQRNLEIRKPKFQILNLRFWISPNLNLRKGRFKPTKKNTDSNVSSLWLSLAALTERTIRRRMIDRTIPLTG